MKKMTAKTISAAVEKQREIFSIIVLRNGVPCAALPGRAITFTFTFTYEPSTANLIELLPGFSMPRMNKFTPGRKL